ncbi:putative salicylate hydroxylase [Periconia macrospinosa]|uniref:Putative salicylate hydroxylase n=1 Tax=Periconia macrospinosa TaxID=97972 RepID=A0A2V1DG45_9PLEO|nr:putative salicylate hydroxylase [Periconia macrospinosa]
MPLKVFVVGAGIAGLTAATALRQAGHEVEIFERSAFATEVGAAVAVFPNGARVLSRLGFSFPNARPVAMESIQVLNGENLGLIQRGPFGSGHAQGIHRVDLHTELLRLALEEGGNDGPAAKLHLSSEVVGAETDGTILLKNGETRKADLVVAADGLKSVLRNVVTKEAKPPTPTGLSSFRFLIDTSVLLADDKMKATLERKERGACMLADVRDMEKERHMMWYACRGGEVQNFVGIHPSRDVDGDDAEAVKASMLEEFSHFTPEVLEIVKHSSDVKCWPLFVHQPLSTWFNGRIVLIGDAAHPMLPFAGQGSNLAMEDGGALGHLFSGVDDVFAVPERLGLFQKARQARAARVQILSSVRAGKEKEVEEQLKAYSDPPGSKVPSNLVEHTIHDQSFDVFKKCEDVLAAA